MIAERTVQAQQILSQPEWQAAWQVGYHWTQAQAMTEAEQWLAVD